MDGVIDSLAGVLVWTAEARFDAMAAFYRDDLGLQPRSQRRGFVNFEWGALRLTVAVHSEIAGAASEPGRIMLNFAVDDIEAVHDRLVEREITFLRPPDRESWGWVATFADPDGNIVQLIQPDER